MTNGRAWRRYHWPDLLFDYIREREDAEAAAAAPLRAADARRADISAAIKHALESDADVDEDSSDDADADAAVSTDKVEAFASDDTAPAGSNSETPEVADRGGNASASGEEAVADDDAAKALGLIMTRARLRETRMVRQLRVRTRIRSTSLRPCVKTTLRPASSCTCLLYLSPVPSSNSRPLFLPRIAPRLRALIKGGDAKCWASWGRALLMQAVDRGSGRRRCARGAASGRRRGAQGGRGTSASTTSRAMS